MRRTPRPWQLAALVSSLSLGGLFLAYARWRVQARADEPVLSAPAALAAPAAEEEGAEEGLGGEPMEFMSGSKSMLGGSPQESGAFRSRVKRRPPAEAPPSRESAESVGRGGPTSRPPPPGLGMSGR